MIKLRFLAIFVDRQLLNFFDMDAKLYLMNKTEMKEYKMCDIIVYPFGEGDLR